MFKVGAAVRWLFFLLGVIESQMVFTQLFETINFTPTTKQVLIRPNLGDLTLTKQYSIWGWFRFTGETPAISNIVALRNLEQVSGNSPRPFPDPSYPLCPVTAEDMAGFPELKDIPEISGNPNCFPERAGAVEQAGLVRTSTDILYVNYDLTSLTDYSIIFLAQAGISAVGTSDMRVLGFTGLPLTKNVWTYFAFSADYEKGTATAFVRVFDGVIPPQKDSMSLSYPQFSLTQMSQLVVAGVESNPYFESTSGFIGDIALVEMALFHSQDIELFWAGFMPLEGYARNGLLLDLLFDAYSKDGFVSSTQATGSRRFAVRGDYSPLFLSDPNRVGVDFASSAGVDLSGFGFANQDALIRPLGFFFNVNFTSGLPDVVYLLQKGVPGSPNFLGISLVKAGNGRQLRIELQGPQGPVSWTADRILAENTPHQIFAGLSMFRNDTAQAFYWDNSGRVESAQIADNFPFSTAGEDFRLLSNAPGSSGRITLNRFAAFDSISPVLLESFLSRTDNSTFIADNRNCRFRTNYYGNDYTCFICLNSISTPQGYSCNAYCPWGSRNATTDVCVPCLDASACSEFDSTRWTLYKINETYWELRPSRPILYPSDLNGLFSINFPGLAPGDYSYQFIPDPSGQSVGLRVQFNRPVSGQGFSVNLNQNRDNPMFDANRNILYVTNTTGVAGSSPSPPVVVAPVCRLSQARISSLRGLAIASLVLMLAGFVIVALLTLLCCRRFFEPLAAWKFLLQYWMRLQMIALFALLSVYLSCCLRSFFEILFNIGVSWNQGLGKRVNSLNANDRDFQAGLYSTNLPSRFADFGVFSPMLNNIGVFFIIQCAIFVLYLVLKLWDCLLTQSNGCLYRLFVFMEYTGLIIGYLLVAMQAWVFAGLNFRAATWNSSYFIISFIIAVCYVAVFVGFWLYAAFRILGDGGYLLDPLNYNKFYFFFAGYRNDRWSRSYDLWWTLAYFIIGMVIGLLYDQRVAQIIIILVTLVLLFLVTLLLRPYRSPLFYAIELLSQLLVIVAVVLLLIIAIYNDRGCLDCSDLDTEGGFCWAIVLLLFFALLLSFLALAAHTLLSSCLPDKYRRWGINTNELVQTNFINTNHVVNDQYFNQYAVLDQNQFPPAYRPMPVFAPQGQGFVQEIQTTAQTFNPPASVFTQGVFDTGAALGAAGNGKSMAQFMNDINIGDGFSDQNLSYVSQNLSSNLRANQLNSDMADEAHIQPRLMNYLSNPSQSLSQNYQFSSDKTQAAVPNLGGDINRKKEEFYRKLKERNQMMESELGSDGIMRADSYNSYLN